MNEFFTWEYLGTFAGMVVGVNLLTQATKTFFDFATRWLVLAYAILLQGCVLIFTGTISIPNAVMALFNAILVAFTAIGGYEVVADKRQNSEKVNPSAEESENGAGK